jgi:hypothetical protein
MSKSTFLAAVLLMSAAALASSLLVANHVFLRTPHNADEFSYLFQAHNFAEGRIARPFPPNFQAFYDSNCMIILNRDAGWLSRYPFGHSLFLLLGLALGDPYLVSALAAGLSVLAVCWTGRLTGGYAAGLAAGLALLLSPFRLFYGGTLLSHTSGLLKVSVMLLAYAGWRLRNRHIFAVLAGLAWAWYFNNRTYTALLIALPFAGDAIALVWRERTRQRLAGAGWFAACSLAGVVLLLVYNRLAVGSFRTMTYLFYTPTEALGFGLRHYGRIDHTPQRGLAILLSHLASLNLRLWGFPGSLVVWTGLLLIGWRRYWSRLCLGAVLAVCLGYVYFWYAGAVDAGPAYYYETLPFLALGAAFGLVRILRRLGWKAGGAGAAVVLFFATGLTLRTAADLRVRYLPRARILRAVEEAPAGSLIYIRPEANVEAHRDGYRMIYNPRGLDGDSVVAYWIPEAHQGMMRYFPGYTPYDLITDEQGVCRLVPLAPDPIPLLAEYNVTRAHRRTGTNEDWTDRGRGPLRVAREGVHEEGLIFFGRDTFTAPGRYVLESDLKTETGGGGRPVARIEIAADRGNIILGETEVGGDGGWRTARLEFETTDFHMIEPRIRYYGRGNVFLAALRVRELP